MSVRRATGGGRVPRVVVCTADVGCGHGRAAAAVTLALRSGPDPVEVHVMDALAEAPLWFTRLYRDTYLAGVRHTPRLNGWFYDWSDRTASTSSLPGVGWLEGRALAEMCESPAVMEADVIVCTHFLCARVFSRMRAEGVLAARLAVVITDQHPHAVWRVPHADAYLVASDLTADELERHGTARGKVTVTGIPIDARFDRPMGKAEACRKHGLPAEKPVILISGGGLGLGGLDEALEGVLSVDGPHHSIVVCGQNKRLYDELVARYGETSWRCRIIGHTARMHELMAAADLLVGKPGGLTTSEAAAMGLPMVLLRPLPGQEEHNASAAVKNGMAVLHREPSVAGRAAAQLTRDRETLARMATASRRVGRPGSAEGVAKVVMELCGGVLTVDEREALGV